MTRIGFALLAAGLLLPAGGQPAHPPAAWPTYRISQAPPEFRHPIQRGDPVILSLQDAMLGEVPKK